MVRSYNNFLNTLIGGDTITRGSRKAKCRRHSCGIEGSCGEKCFAPIMRVLTKISKETNPWKVPNNDIFLWDSLNYCMIVDLQIIGFFLIMTMAVKMFGHLKKRPPKQYISYGTS